MLANLFGYGGAVTLSLMTIPQIYKSYQSREMDSISPYFLCLQFLTSFFFLIYGVLLGKIPIIVANSISLCGVCILLILRNCHSVLIKDVKNANISEGGQSSSNETISSEQSILFTSSTVT